MRHIITKLFCVFTFIFCFRNLSYAQVGIGTNVPNASAKLDVSSTNKGFLPPRVALTSSIDTLTIVHPATGLLVYNITTSGNMPNTVVPGYYYYNGTVWVSMSASVAIPTGTINTFAGVNAPVGYLICDGSAVSRATYANLFAVIDTTYGAGDGSTTFNLPDLRGRTTIGAGTGNGLTNRIRGSKQGEESHTQTVAEMPSHKHISTYWYPVLAVNNQTLTSNLSFENSNFQYSGTTLNISVPYTVRNYYFNTANSYNENTSFEGGSQPFNVMNPSLTLNYIIKF